MHLSSRYLRSFEADLQTRSSLAQCRLAITTEPLHSEVEAPHAAQPSGAVDPDVSDVEWLDCESLRIMVMTNSMKMPFTWPILQQILGTRKWSRCSRLKAAVLKAGSRGPNLVASNAAQNAQTFALDRSEPADPTVTGAC